MSEDNLPQLRMIRESLEDLPESVAPPGYRFRSYRPGDEAAWGEIMDSGIPISPQPAESGAGPVGWTVERVREKLTEKPQFDPEGLFFAVDREGKPVGSACAWRWSKEESRIGYLHMVAVLPDHQGHDLGYALSLAVLRHLKQRGFSEVRLTTDIWRLPAIKAYLRLGFRPEYAHPSDAYRWLRVYEQLQARDPSFQGTQPPVVFGPIGFVRNEIDQPIHSGWEEVESEIVVEPEFERALDGLEEHSHVTVIFYINGVDAAHRLLLKLRPRDQADLPEVGVFSTHTQYRPNPIGITNARIVSRQGRVLRVRGLDAIDGTPVLDLKNLTWSEKPEGFREPGWLTQTRKDRGECR